ncbi:MAG: hypothetical protein ACXVP0_15870, partial [Bacteroidia bacterium]
FQRQLVVTFNSEVIAAEADVKPFKNLVPVANAESCFGFSELKINRTVMGADFVQPPQIPKKIGCSGREENLPPVFFPFVRPNKILRKYGSAQKKEYNTKMGFLHFKVL